MTAIQNFTRFRATILGFLALLVTVVHAGPTDPLFVNLTSDEPHRALMAIGFGKNQLVRGHGLTVFLNDRAVLLGAKSNSAQFAEQQKLLAEILAKGGKVMICPMCMKKYGVKPNDILDGLVVSTPELTGAAVFAEGARTLSW